MASKLKSYDVVAVFLLVLYTVAFSWAMVAMHDGFETYALDLGKFDQAIWNTAQGRPFQITLGEQSVLQSHFSPALALFAPLFWVWSNIRLLFVVQALSVAGAGLLIHWYLRDRQPWLALGAYAAYLMHPAVHQVTLVGFNRLTLAMVATSFAVFYLLRRRYGWMTFALVVSLLCKEDMALAWVAVGLYVTFLHRSPKIGISLAVVGTAFLVLVPFVLLPVLSGSTGYVHAETSFGYLGSTVGEIAHSLISQPGLLFKYPLRPGRPLALWRFLWPTLFFFLLTPEIMVFSIPYLAYLLMSTSDTMGRLGNWYPSVILVFLFWAVAIGLTRMPKRWQKPALSLLLAASFSGWLMYSQMWPGAAFSASALQVTTHDRLVDAALRSIPAQEVVAAQDRLVPHLSHRQQIYLFPWMPPKEEIDLFALDRQTSPYPMSAEDYRGAFYDFLADPHYEIVQQIDGFYLFRHTDTPAPAVSRQDSWGDIMTLTGYTVTQASPGGEYQNTTVPASTKTARVELFWRVEQATDQNDSVAVHVIDSQSRILGQDDSWPVDGQRPTSALAPGTLIRDVHELSWSQAAAPEELSLRVGLYDSATQQPLLLADGEAFIVVPLVR